MPTVLRIDSLRVVIYPNDHRPSHVHVIRDQCEAVFNLNCPDGPPELRENLAFKPVELTKIRAVLAANLAALCAAWSKIHGRF
ncbi:MAG: DUF4160 domain-containing protein [Candidatus Competibacteraceae bacterium]|jgi:Fe2+ or Zn2+ uptake regulation protein|nr:DUF4160 domain-containing protein [Candidatus Competibacteraceae bacterium]MBK8897002.1 DUF4160 domain-containing protein [Candidatus Competibacteraceae bacterium]